MRMNLWWISALLISGVISVAETAQKTKININQGQSNNQEENNNTPGGREKRDANKGNGQGQQGQHEKAKQNIGKSKVVLHLTDSRDELEIGEEFITANGNRRARVTQKFNGLRVFGVSTSIEFDNEGQPTGDLFGHVINGINFDLETVEVTISGPEAVDILIQAEHPDATLEQIGKRDWEKIIYVQDDDRAAVCWLVFYFHYGAYGQPDSRPVGIIHGDSGVLLKSWDSIEALRLTVPVGNIRDTNQIRLNMHAQEIDTGICYYKSSKAELMDMEGLTLLRRPDFLIRGFPCMAATDSTGFDFTNDTYSPMNEIYLYSMYTHDMFMEYLNRAPLGNSTFTSIIRARAHINGCYDNAFWDGQAVNFGDGCTQFYPLTTMDVIGHEIAHGFTMYTSNLVYTGQSGGINEAFSDITGETLEYYIKTKNGLGSNDWLVGNGIKISGGPLRYMETPSKDGVSIDHINQYYNGLSLHRSSGLFNKAFYTLSKSTNWNIVKAFKTFAYANLIYWEAESTFHCAACGLEFSARDMGYSEFDVRNALAAVGVSCLSCV